LRKELEVGHNRSGDRRRTKMRRRLREERRLAAKAVAADQPKAATTKASK
jgi:hypothetical protein